MAAITLEELSMKVGVCPDKLDNCISDDHLLKIALFLTSWQTVVPFLGLSEVEVNDVEQGVKDEQVKRLKALQKWKSKFAFKATYKKLMEVSLSLSLADVAEKICHLLKEDVPGYVSESNDLKLQSGLGPDSSITNTVNGTNAGLNPALAIQSSFQTLNRNDRDVLMAKLRDDEKSMKLEFGSLVTTTCYSVQKHVSIEIFCVSILSLKAYEPAPGERDRSLLDQHSGEIKKAKSVAEIFCILMPYWNYLNYEILEYIIKEHGRSDDMEKLRGYEDKLKKFCERRFFELSLPDNGDDSGKTFPNQEKFAVKLDKTEGIKGKELLQIRMQIAKILQVNVATLVIYSLDEGCVQLTFLMPKFVAREIFPLSYEQASALSQDASVFRLECGHYAYKSTIKSYTEGSAIQSTVSLELIEDCKLPLQRGLCTEKPEGNAQHQTSGATQVPLDVSGVSKVDFTPLVKTPTKSPADPRKLHHTQNKGDTVKAPIKHDSADPRELHHLCKEFANTFTELADILNTSVQISTLKNFLKSYCHPLYPEKHYVDPHIYETATTTKELLEILVPQYINYVHYYLLKDIVVTFGCDRAIQILQQYTDEKYSRKRKLEDLPGPTTDEEIEQFHGAKKLKVQVEGDTSGGTVEIINEIQKALEKSTGIKRAVITYGFQDQLNNLPGPITDGEIEQFHGTEKLKVQVEGDKSYATVKIISEIRKALDKATGIKRAILTFHDKLSSLPGPITDGEIERFHGLKVELEGHTSDATVQIISKIQKALEKTTGIKRAVITFEFHDKLNSLPDPITDGEIEQFHGTKKVKVEVEGETSNATVKIISEIRKALNKATGIKRAILTFVFHDKLNSLPGPITDGEIEQFHGTKKLKVEIKGDASDATVEIIGETRKALEKATGIKEAFIVYAFYDPGSVLLTFLIPESIHHIFHELSTEDLGILADSCVMKLEVDDEVVIDDIQQYSNVKRSATNLELSVGSGETTNTIGLQNYLSQRAAEMTSDRHLYLLNMLGTAETGMLNDVCSEEFLENFAKDLQDWKKLAPYFSINIKELVWNYPDENDQKYQALLCWKKGEGSTAIYYNLLESLILHGKIGEVEALLQRLGQGPVVLHASRWLKQQYLAHDSWQQWREIPNLI